MLNPDSDISVIVPVYNGERYLAEALRSVLDQSVAPAEIIVVDDGSTDQSAAVAGTFSRHVRCLYQSNRGTSSARNRGVDESMGSFLAFLDQDDLWERDKLGLQLATLEHRPELAAVFGHVRQFLSPDLENDMRQRLTCPEEPQEGYSPSSMLVRRDAFYQIGTFGGEWKHAEWIEWLLRLEESGLLTEMLTEVVAYRRIHAENKGVVQREGSREYLFALKRSIDRRRNRAKGSR